MKRMRIRYVDTEGQVEIAPGVTIWKKATTQLRPYKGYNVDAEVSVSERGKLEVDSIRVSRTDGGEPVTGEALRKITVQSILRDAVKTAIQMSVGKDIPAGTAVSAMGMIATEEALRLKNQGPTAETLEWVGRVYRVSELVNDPPTKAVEDVFQVSRSTAGAWIGRARAAGHIPPVGSNNGES